MSKRKKEPEISDLRAEIRRELARWKTIKAKGTTDPFWPDGTNLNLVRNHVFYYQENLKERCRVEKVRPCPKEAWLKPPPKVSETYMVPGSKAARHSILPIKRKSRNG